MLGVKESTSIYSQVSEELGKSQGTVIQIFCTNLEILLWTKTLYQDQLYVYLGLCWEINRDNMWTD